MMRLGRKSLLEVKENQKTSAQRKDNFAWEGVCNKTSAIRT